MAKLLVSEKQEEGEKGQGQVGSGGFCKTTMTGKNNKNKYYHHVRQENEIVPPLCSVLCPHSVIPPSPLTRNSKMPKPYSKQNTGMLKQQVLILEILQLWHVFASFIPNFP